MRQGPELTHTYAPQCYVIRTFPVLFFCTRTFLLSSPHWQRRTLETVSRRWWWCADLLHSHRVVWYADGTRTGYRSHFETALRMRLTIRPDALPFNSVTFTCNYASSLQRSTRDHWLYNHQPVWFYQDIKTITQSNCHSWTKFHASGGKTDFTTTSQSDFIKTSKPLRNQIVTLGPNFMHLEEKVNREAMKCGHQYRKVTRGNHWWRQHEYLIWPCWVGSPVTWFKSTDVSETVSLQMIVPSLRNRIMIMQTESVSETFGLLEPPDTTFMSARRITKTGRVECMGITKEHAELWPKTRREEITWKRYK